MSDLISRDALLAAIKSSEPALPDEFNDIIVEAPAVVPQVVANISGGVLQGASCDHRVDLYCLDFDDVPYDDPERVIEVEGSSAYFSQSAACVDRGFVREVLDAITDSEEEDA